MGIRWRHVLFYMLATALFSVPIARAAISFTAAEPFTVSARPDAVATADLNRDGHVDVIAVSRRSDEMNVLLGSASTPSRFSSGTVLRFGTKLNAPVIADVNQDHIPDVLVADQGQGARGVWILLGRGDGTFGRPDLAQIGSQPVAVAVADFDGIHGADIAIADRQRDGVIIGLNDGQNPPRFNFLSPLPVGRGPDEIVAADINGDGILDLATLNVNGPIVKDIGVLIFQRVTSGIPVFESVRNFGVGENPFSLDTGDLNDDGTDDLITLNRLLNAPDQVQVFLARGDGTLQAPLSFSIPCPFFTGGRFCRTQAMTIGDLDGNDRPDLAIALTDPRLLVTTDGVQVFSGNGDGSFVGGAVFPVGKNPTSVGTGDIVDNDMLDIVVATKQRLRVQVFINESTPGGTGNGTPCIEGDECLSGRCTNGRCCATQCFDFERCDVPTHEGVCIRTDPPVECFDALDCDGEGRCQTDASQPCDANGDCDGICLLKTCRNGFCCDQNCSPIEDRCDVSGFEGICIPKGDLGEGCFEDDDCSTGFCRDGFCCNQDCQNGACNIPGLPGVCRPLLPNGDFCDDDDRACLSGVCDDFDLICCNRGCLPDEFCNEVGECEAFSPRTPTPVGTPAGTATATVSITRTPTATRTLAPTPSPTVTSTPIVCPGDCDGSGEVLVDEVITGVALLLGRPAKTCGAADPNHDADVSIDEVVLIAEAALHGCGSLL